MINSSKEFVKYLDNYDKSNQIKYKKRLFNNIQSEYNSIWGVPNTTVFPMNIEPVNTSNNNCSLPLGSIFDNILLPDSTIMSRKNSIIEDDKTIEKKKITIEDKIESLEDMVTIINKYEYNKHYEYNIDFHSIYKIREELKTLNKMVGMEKLKRNVLDQLLYFLQDLHVSENGGDYKHTVIYGPPGTGKTEVAKIIGKMYSKIGILNKDIFIKVTRQDLIAGYLGQTAIKTGKVIEEAKGGVLFIDEAYALGCETREDSFSKECIDTLCEALSNYKMDIMVIIAGYEEELNNTFFRMNRGLQSRFIWRFTMEPYNAIQLKQIFGLIVEDAGWSFSEEDNIGEKWFEKHIKVFKSFGRDMEQLFTYVKICHGRRIYGLTDKQKKKINVADMNNGYKLFVENRKEKDISHLYGMYL
jgi:SpoVK/Ycf46/Vps4 family AAA+-type ATPase